jgi:hypothetical protein
MRVAHGAVCSWGVKRYGVQYSTMEGYHDAALPVELDVQVRGGGGVAERLHASCRHLVAGAEVERRERKA